MAGRPRRAPACEVEALQFMARASAQRRLRGLIEPTRVARDTVGSVLAHADHKGITPPSGPGHRLRAQPINCATRVLEIKSFAARKRQSYRRGFSHHAFPPARGVWRKRLDLANDAAAFYGRV